jgi:LuxR family maltose regulon positive regulatory protein
MLAPPLLRAQGRGAEAHEMVDRAEHSARQRGVGAEVVWCQAMRARLARQEGNLAGMATWAAAYQSSVEHEVASEGPLGYIEQFAEATYVRALLSLGRADEAAHLIGVLLERAEAGDQTGHTIEFLALAALACRARGDAQGAHTILERAMALAESEGFVHTFVDEGEPIVQLLIEGTGRWSAVSAAYVRRLLTVAGRRTPDDQTTARPMSAGHPTPQSRGQSRTLVEPLTEREREVLALLAAGLANRDIAERLIVTVGTVKRHTGNIYGKLGVVSRAQAILKAQEFALL